MSIGTTYKLVEGFNSEDRPRLKTSLGIVSHGKSLIKIAIDYIASAFDLEKAWESYLGILKPPSSCRDRHVRLNPQLDKEPPHLDDPESMRYIKAVARRHFSKDGQIQHVANKLIASSFYFERSSHKSLMSDGAIQYQGLSCPDLYQILDEFNTEHNQVIHTLGFHPIVES